MRLTFVGTSRHARGTEQHLVSLAAAMRARGHEVSALLDPVGFMQQAACDAGLRVALGRFRNALDPRGWWGLLRELRRFRPDWVIGSFGHEYFPVSVLGRVAGCRVVLFRHLNTKLKLITRRLLPRLFRRMIAVSDDMRGDLLAQGLPAEKLALLYKPIDTERFAPSEPFGRVSVEAQACGVFVLASDVGGLPETLGPGSGRLLPRDDADAWVAALNELAGLPVAARREWGEAAVRSAARFDSAKIAAEFEALLSSA